MQVLDNQEDEFKNLSAFAAMRARQAALWRIITNSVGLLIALFVLSMISKEFRFHRWRTEELCLTGFVLISAVRFILFIISGARERMANPRDPEYDLIAAARFYNIAWIITGICACIFVVGMILYLAAKIELFGEVSEALFDIRFFR